MSIYDVLYIAELAEYITFHAYIHVLCKNICILFGV
jgi:hypothetical protein